MYVTVINFVVFCRSNGMLHYEVLIPKRRLHGNLCGLCGRPNNDPNDDQNRWITHHKSLDLNSFLSSYEVLSKSHFWQALLFFLCLKYFTTYRLIILSNFFEYECTQNYNGEFLSPMIIIIVELTDPVTKIRVQLSH